MICDGCKRELPSNVKFCPACGKAVTGDHSPAGALRCPKCGAAYPDGTKFCRVDGQPLQPAAAVLTAPAAAPAGSPPASAAPKTSAPAAPPPGTKVAPQGPADQAVVVPRKTPLVVYGVALVVLAVVGCLIWFLFLGQSGPTSVSDQASVTAGPGSPTSSGEPSEEESPGAAASPEGSGSSTVESKTAAPVMVVTGQPPAREAEPAPQAIPPCREDICIEVSNAVCSPASAAVGAQVRCVAAYTLVQSRDKEPLEIEESVELDGDKRAAQRVQRRSGRNRLEITFTVPKKTRSGWHTVTLKARRRGVTGSADAPLTIN
jgi:hypothetical protein